MFDSFFFFSQSVVVDTPGGPIKPPYPRVSVTATYTSTVAEEMVALLRKLHSLDVWNPHINAYITSKLPSIIALLQPRSPVCFFLGGGTFFVCFCLAVLLKEGGCGVGANSKHWFMTSFL